MNAILLKTDFGIIQFAMHRYNEGVLTAEQPIVVNNVSYEYCQHVKLDDNGQWIADNSGHCRIRRTDWLNRGYSESFPTHSARNKMETIFAKLNEDWSNLSDRAQQSFCQKAEMNHVQTLIEIQQRRVEQKEEELSEEQEKLASLQSQLYETQRWIHTT